MGNSLLLVLAGIAFVLFAATESHAAGFAFGTADYRFELYTGQSYTYSAFPYTYVSGDYYYFDYPFRLYSNSNYYYFQPGWYDFAPSFAYSPYSTAYYTYYPSSYYYYNSTWTYAPNWVGTYGLMYYGNYYYPPQQVTLLGSGYKPTKEADCSEVSVSAQDFTVDAGKSTTQTFYINNDSGKYLDIQNAQVFIDGFDAGARNVKFDRTIANGSGGKITFEAFAASNAKSASTNGNARVYAAFRDGTSCTGQDIEGNFIAAITGAAPAFSNTVENINRYNGSPHYNTRGSTSYNRARQTQQEWIDAQPAKSNYPATGARKGNAQGKNNFTDNKANFAGATAGQAATTQTVTAPYGPRQAPATDCSGLSASVKNISVQAGKTGTDYFTFKNFTGEDFLIDRMEAISASPGFSLTAHTDSARMYAGETGGIKAGVFADDSVNETTASAYLSMEGHFASGLSCRLISDNFLVKVNVPEGNVIGKISLDVPANVQVAGGSGFVEFGFTNSSGRDLELDIYSTGADVSPAKITLPAHTTGRRTIAVNGVDAGRGARVEFAVRSEGMALLSRYTDVANTEAANAPPTDGNAPATVDANKDGNGATIPTSAGTAPKDESAAKKITNLAGAGFAVLTEGSTILTALAIIIILTALWAVYRASIK